MPEDAPEWLRTMIADRSVSAASEAFWNAVEGFEKRSDAQLAKDVTIALPIELSVQQNIALVRDFVASQVTARGMVADWVFHDVPGNPHVHLMTTLRPLTEDGFGAKKVAVIGPDGKVLRNDAGKPVYELWAGGIDDFNAFQDGWFACHNRHLALAGLDLHVDGRSFERQSIELTPTIHLGVGTKAIERKAQREAGAIDLERLALQEERRRENARRIERNPDLVLDLITREKSVFGERDFAKILHRHIDDVDLFQSLMIRILQSPQVLRLDRERIEFATGQRIPAKYTTRDLIRLEAEMANRAGWLSQRSSHGVHPSMLEATFKRHDRLSEEQKRAIEHVAGVERIAAVIGRAGAGKTTMVKAARAAWEAAGYKVVGAALAGKAAEGLEREAGIAARTLSSWELGWSKGRGRLDGRTVFVLDEAGMVSSRQMAHVVDTVTRAGAKLVLIGDPDQLQPIEAGAAFRAIADRIGYAELETIYRQREQWMREASLDLARGDVGKAIEAYGDHCRMFVADLKTDAVANLIADWDRDYDPARSTLILAHLRRDVRMLNALARDRLVERGIIASGYRFRTADGDRSFAAGDQIVFLRNEGSIGVKNGMLAKVVEAAPGRIVAETGEGEHRRQVTVEERFYSNLDHGYATTIHKSQGATVDRVKILASLSLDRHLTYVAMTRHREDLGVYYGRRSFAKAGGLDAVLSQKNAKETTLDYEGRSTYRQALRFAETRGLNIVHVARTILRDRLEWTVRQKERLADLAGRLAAVGASIGLSSAVIPDRAKAAKPMVAGITTHLASISQVLDDRIAAGPALNTQWEDFHLVYAQPEAAFRAVNVDAMLRDQAVAERTIARIANAPESFGVLKGKTGIFASRTDKAQRERALLNVGSLGRSIGRYLRLRSEAEHRYHAEETIVRQRAALDIPALSTNARQTLERVRDAIDRNDLQSALEYALADRMIKAELDRFARAVFERFGDRVLLPLSAKEADGEVFHRVTPGMNAVQKAEVQQAWHAMRAVQQLSTHERTEVALREAEVLRLVRSKGLGLR